MWSIEPTALLRDLDQITNVSETLSTLAIARQEGSLTGALRAMETAHSRRVEAVSRLQEANWWLGYDPIPRLSGQQLILNVAALDASCLAKGSNWWGEFGSRDDMEFNKRGARTRDIACMIHGEPRDPVQNASAVVLGVEGDGGFAATLTLERLGTEEDGVFYLHPFMSCTTVDHDFARAMQHVAEWALDNQIWDGQSDIRLRVMSRTEDHVNPKPELCLRDTSMSAAIAILFIRLAQTSTCPYPSLRRVNTAQIAIAAEFVRGSLGPVSSTEPKIKAAGSDLRVKQVVLGISSGSENNDAAKKAREEINYVLAKDGKQVIFASALADLETEFARPILDEFSTEWFLTSSHQEVTEKEPVENQTFTERPRDMPLKLGGTSAGSSRLLPEKPKPESEGRAAEVQKGWGILQRGEPLFVFGKSGFGKTEYARMLCDQRLSGAGVTWLDLPVGETPSSASEIVSRITREIAVQKRWWDVARTQNAETALKLLREHLGSEEWAPVLVLDNADSPFQHSAACRLAQEITPRLVVLSCVPFLSADRAIIQILGLEQEDAWKVFKKLADLADQDRSSADSLLALLGGHPLAIRLVGGILRATDQRHKETKMQKLRSGLVERGVTADSWSTPEYALRRVFDLACAELSAQTYRLVEALAVFADDGTSPEALGQLSEVPTDLEFSYQLDQLVTMGLVDRVRRSDEDWVRMHARIHQLARERLRLRMEAELSRDTPFGKTVIGRMADYYAEYARAYRDGQRGNLELERRNLHQTANWLIEYSGVRERDP